jgi:hypothetical protein
MQSYRKAIEWRVQSWDASLSRSLAKRERKLVEGNAPDVEIRKLLQSGEAMILLKLREIAEKIKVLDACTTFNVMPQRVTKEADGNESPSKKRRMSEAGLEESEYQYQVTHMMALEGFLNIFTPAGHVQIELQVPGSMAGTFLSAEAYSEELTDVRIELNTEILASMIEKSSRMVVRSSVEALLKGDADEGGEAKEEEATPITKEEDEKNEEVSTKTPPSKPLDALTCTPQRRVSEDRVSGLVVITPARDTSSPSSYGDSDNDENSVLLSIPDNFKSGQLKASLRMLTPQPSRPRHRGNFTFGPTSKEKLPTVVTPHKTHRAEVQGCGKGPILPLLVEAACAAMRKK